MNEEILFEEKQYFRQWWIILLISFINCIFIAGIYTQIIEKKSFGNNPMSDNSLIILTIAILIFSYIFFILNLKTVIKKDGIYIRFFPFHFKYIHYPWEKISLCYIRKYSPLFEYGGWGIRYGFHGKAFNIQGNMGLQLKFTEGRKLLIGTSKPEEMNKVLEALGQLKKEI